MALDAGRDLVEVALQHVDHVVGQERLGEAGEATDVGEEDADRQLLADRAGSALGPAAPATAQAAAHHRLGVAAPAPEVGLLQVVLVEDQAADGDLTRHPHLAGEAQLGAEAQPVRHRALLGGPRRAGRGTVDDDDAAGRTDGVAAAGVGEGDPGAEGRRQDRLGRAALDDGLVREDADGRHGSAGDRGTAGAVGPAPPVADRNRTDPHPTDRRPGLGGRRALNARAAPGRRNRPPGATPSGRVVPVVSR